MLGGRERAVASPSDAVAYSAAASAATSAAPLPLLPSDRFGGPAGPAAAPADGGSRKRALSRANIQDALEARDKENGEQLHVRMGHDGDAEQLQGAQGSIEAHGRHKKRMRQAVPAPSPEASAASAAAAISATSSLPVPPVAPPSSSASSASAISSSSSSSSLSFSNRERVRDVRRGVLRHRPVHVDLRPVPAVPPMGSPDQLWRFLMPDLDHESETEPTLLLLDYPAEYLPWFRSSGGGGGAAAAAGNAENDDGDDVMHDVGAHVVSLFGYSWQVTGVELPVGVASAVATFPVLPSDVLDSCPSSSTAGAATRAHHHLQSRHGQLPLAFSLCRRAILVVQAMHNDIVEGVLHPMQSDDYEARLAAVQTQISLIGEFVRFLHGYLGRAQSVLAAHRSGTDCTAASDGSSRGCARCEFPARLLASIRAQLVRLGVELLQWRFGVTRPSASATTVAAAAAGPYTPVSSPPAASPASSSSSSSQSLPGAGMAMDLGMGVAWAMHRGTDDDDAGIFVDMHLQFHWLVLTTACGGGGGVSEPLRSSTLDASRECSGKYCSLLVRELVQLMRSQPERFQLRKCVQLGSRNVQVFRNSFWSLFAMAVRSVALPEVFTPLLLDAPGDEAEQHANETADERRYSALEGVWSFCMAICLPLVSRFDGFFRYGQSPLQSQFPRMSAKELWNLAQLLVNASLQILPSDTALLDGAPGGQSHNEMESGVVATGLLGATPDPVSYERAILHRVVALCQEWMRVGARNRVCSDDDVQLGSSGDSGTGNEDVGLASDVILSVWKHFSALRAAPSELFCTPPPPSPPPPPLSLHPSGNGRGSDSQAWPLCDVPHILKFQDDGRTLGTAVTHATSQVLLLSDGVGQVQSLEWLDYLLVALDYFLKCLTRRSGSTFQVNRFVTRLLSQLPPKGQTLGRDMASVSSLVHLSHMRCHLSMLVLMASHLSESRLPLIQSNLHGMVRCEESGGQARSLVFSALCALCCVCQEQGTSVKQIVPLLGDHLEREVKQLLRLVGGGSGSGGGGVGGGGGGGGARRLGPQHVPQARLVSRMLQAVHRVFRQFLSGEGGQSGELNLLEKPWLSQLTGFEAMRALGDDLHGGCDVLVRVMNVLCELLRCSIGSCPMLPASMRVVATAVFKRQPQRQQDMPADTARNGTQSRGGGGGGGEEEEEEEEGGGGDGVDAENDGDGDAQMTQDFIEELDFLDTVAIDAAIAAHKREQADAEKRRLFGERDRVSCSHVLEVLQVIKQHAMPGLDGYCRRLLRSASAAPSSSSSMKLARSILRVHALYTICWARVCRSTMAPKVARLEYKARLDMFGPTSSWATGENSTPALRALALGYFFDLISCHSAATSIVGLEWPDGDSDPLLDACGGGGGGGGGNDQQSSAQVTLDPHVVGRDGLGLGNVGGRLVSWWLLAMVEATPHSWDATLQMTRALACPSRQAIKYLFFSGRGPGDWEWPAALESSQSLQAQCSTALLRFFHSLRHNLFLPMVGLVSHGLPHGNVLGVAHVQSWCHSVVCPVATLLLRCARENSNSGTRSDNYARFAYDAVVEPLLVECAGFLYVSSHESPALGVLLQHFFASTQSFGSASERANNCAMRAIPALFGALTHENIQSDSFLNRSLDAVMKHHFVTLSPEQHGVQRNRVMLQALSDGLMASLSPSLSSCASAVFDDAASLERHAAFRHHFILRTLGEYIFDAGFVGSFAFGSHNPLVASTVNQEKSLHLAICALKVIDSVVLPLENQRDWPLVEPDARIFDGLAVPFLVALLIPYKQQPFAVAGGVVAPGGAGAGAAAGAGGGTEWSETRELRRFSRVVYLRISALKVILSVLVRAVERDMFQPIGASTSTSASTSASPPPPPSFWNDSTLCRCVTLAVVFELLFGLRYATFMENGDHDKVVGIARSLESSFVAAVAGTAAAHGSITPGHRWFGSRPGIDLSVLCQNGLATSTARECWPVAKLSFRDRPNLLAALLRQCFAALTAIFFHASPNQAGRTAVLEVLPAIRRAVFAAVPAHKRATSTAIALYLEFTASLGSSIENTYRVN